MMATSRRCVIMAYNGFLIVNKNYKRRQGGIPTIQKGLLLAGKLPFLGLHHAWAHLHATGTGTATALRADMPIH